MIPHGECRKAICFLSLTHKKFVLGVEKNCLDFVIDLTQAVPRSSENYIYINICVCG